MSKQRTWPSREEWADRQRHPYWDFSETGCPFHDKLKHRLSDYATREEISITISVLKDLYREKGLKMRAAKQQMAERGLPEDVRDRRHLSEADQEIARQPTELKWERQAINNALKHISEDGDPKFYRCTGFKEANKLLGKFKERYDAAFKAAQEQWERECEQIPVDDVAWEKELERRRELEEYFNNPEKRFIRHSL
jgi:hypothetical protein